MKRIVIGAGTIISMLSMIGCKNDSEKARLMLNQAHTLVRQEKPDQAKKLFNDIVAKYGHTEEATEANKMLMTFKVSEEIGKAKADETWKQAIATSLMSFLLDVGRYPTQQEGLKVLVYGRGVPNWAGPYWRPESADVLDRFEYRPNGKDDPYLAVKAGR